MESSRPRRFRSLSSAGDGLVGLRGHAQVVLLDVVVGVPLQVARAAAGDDADEAHAFLHQAAREQTAAAVIVGRRLADAVQCSSVFGGSSDEVEDGGRLGLHLEREIVGVDSGLQFVVAGSRCRLIQVADQVEGLVPIRTSRRPREVEIEHRPPAGPEHRRLVDGRQKAVAVHRLAGFQAPCGSGITT